MNYKTFLPNSDLSPMIKYHWTLDILPDSNLKKQRILPDGCMELIFLLGDDIKRFISKDKFIIQPRSMVLGHITEPFTIQPVGYTSCFSTCFYPYGIANFLKTPL